MNIELSKEQARAIYKMAECERSLALIALKYESNATAIASYNKSKDKYQSIMDLMLPVCEWMGVKY